MPVLSMFYGIIIRMQNERGGKHNKPHIHAQYGEQEIVLDLNGEVITGSMDTKKLNLLIAWITLHEDEIKANWDLLQAGEDYFKIDPLK